MPRRCAGRRTSRVMTGKPASRSAGRRGGFSTRVTLASLRCRVSFRLRNSFPLAAHRGFRNQDPGPPAWALSHPTVGGVGNDGRSRARAEVTPGHERTGACHCHVESGRDMGPTVRPRGGVVTQRIANPCTPVRFRAWPPILSSSNPVRFTGGFTLGAHATHSLRSLHAAPLQLPDRVAAKLAGSGQIGVEDTIHVP